MRITRIEAFALHFPQGDTFGGHGGQRRNDTPYFVQRGWRGIYSHHIETMVVRVETDDGLVGWGEGQSPIAPEVSATIVRTILAPVLMGRDPLEAESLRDAMADLMGLRGHIGGFMHDAIAALDIALWDLKGKALGVPVHVLLGGPRPERIPCYVSGIRGESDADRLADLEHHLVKGFDTFKIFAGFGLAEDVRLFRLLAERGGEQVRIAVDALWQYDRQDALTLGRDLQALGCLWFEAPTDFEDVSGHAELAAALDMAIAGGETERTRRQMWPWIVSGGFDLVQPDIGRCGITEGSRIVELAAFHQRRVTLHCGIASPIMIAASLQVACARPVRLMEYQPVVVATANQLLETPLVVEGGAFQPPAGPGLGIVLREDRIRALAVESAST